MVSIRAGFTFTAEDEEMLNAAHAAMYFWSIVGNANNQAHAVAANVASAGGNTQDHKRHYQEATRLTAALENAEEQQSSKQLSGFFPYRRVCVRVSTSRPLNSA